MNIPFKEIESGVPFLTVNRRLARAIRSRYDLLMKEKGIKVWESPCIIPFLSWLHELWTEHSQKKFLLSPGRSLILWENILKDDDLFIKEELLSGNEVAGAAYDAYRLAKEHKLDMYSGDFRITEESRALLRWSLRYEERLRELGFIDSCQLPVELMKRLNSNGFQLPKKIILAGYDELSPLFRELISAIESKGCRVNFWPPQRVRDSKLDDKTDSRGKISIVSCADEEEEAVRCARWIRKIYRQGMKIGVLSPDLNRYRDKIISAFTEELAPSSIFPWKNEKELFNISLGTSLYNEPIVRSAIDLLGMDNRPREMGEISSFLLSPYFISSHEERIYLAGLDAKFKRENCFSLTSSDLWHAVESENCEAPAFMKNLGLLLKSIKESPVSLLPGSWSESFSKLLKGMDWPANSAKLSSLEYQALQSFGKALSSLAGLDDITGPIRKTEALRYLTKITKEIVFHGESEESPIAVLGLLESGGMTFDRVWFMGAHDNLLPGQPSPNPFIPLKLQKDHDLPKSTYGRELEFSKIHLQRIVSTTGRITFSFPERVDDREVNLSPLISMFHDDPAKRGSEEGNRLIDRMKGPLTVKEKEINQGMEVRENDPLKGGTGILKNQSDCPFRAFAIHRLCAAKPGDPEPGISPTERGSIIHRAMETFWKIVKDDVTLREFHKKGELDQIILDSAQAGLNLLKDKGSRGQNYKRIELERLSSLLHEWIEVELKRSPFKTLESESEKCISIGGLRLSSRIDRIDRVNDHAMALIDYKSGTVSTSDWATDRPKEPQLMLYASRGNYDAVLFARLKRGDCRFTGIAKEGGLFPGTRAFTEDPLFKKDDHISSWEELMEKWRETLESLAASFLSGEASADPRDYLRESSACKYCDHYLFCRIFERNHTL